MIVNFKIHRISQETYKLVQTPILIKKKKSNERYLFQLDSHSP